MTYSPNYGGQHRWNVAGQLPWNNSQVANHNGMNMRPDPVWDEIRRAKATICPKCRHQDRINGGCRLLRTPGKCK
jgi:hypothetical protein